MYAGCPIHFVSKLQNKIALSTAEAEYIALSQALWELIPLMILLKGINNTFPILLGTPEFVCTVHELNKSCIEMAELDKFTLITKHIDLKYHHFRSFVKSKKVFIKYCRTRMQKADLLTKPLSDVIFIRLRIMIFGC